VKKKQEPDLVVGPFKLRFYHKKGKDPSDFYDSSPVLQFSEAGSDSWVTVPHVYEDPDEEIIECPRKDEHSPHPYKVCRICLGGNRGARRLLRERAKEAGIEWPLD